MKINKLHYNQNILTILFLFFLFYQNKFIRFANTNEIIKNKTK